MTGEKITFEQQLAKLKAEYLLQIPHKLAAIASDWEQLKTTRDAETLCTLHRNVHSLIGTSGTFGFTELSKAARVLETTLKPLLEKTDEHLSNTLSLEISAKINTLFNLLTSLQGNKKEAETSVFSLEFTKQLAQQHHFTNAETGSDNTLIYYVDDELSGPNLLIQQLASYGFQATHFRTLPEFLQATAQVKPNLVLLDLIMPDISEVDIFQQAKIMSEQGINVIFLSGKDNFASRLAGVRAGASAYVIKPVDVPWLVDLIRNILQMNTHNPAHILIIDDQDSVAQFYSQVLTQAGMHTTVETNPANALTVMHANVPDLLLLDLNMPEVSGVELAAVIRQQERYQSIPILFLSAESDPARKTSLIEIGSDDLLSKGMPPEELVRQIKSRVARAKKLTAMMYQDSLTGLLNHAQIQLAAERVFSQCKRNQTQCCIAMIDIDHFKTVNDTHGHLTGDRVLKGLAHLLEKRFRITDYIGRYGGEEFMLVLPDININDAGNLINNLRKTFSALEFKEGDNHFNVTFSAGVADRASMGNFIEQIKCADEALYKAKARGRNVVCANLMG
jgi:diguanylate cyclase (GGDEF)-like protein